MELPDTETTNGPPSTRLRSSAANAADSIRSIADVPFRLRAADRARREVLDAYTSAWDSPVDSVDERAREPSRFEYSAEPLARPDRPPDATGPGLAAWHAGGHLLIHDDSGCSAVADEGGLTIHGPALLRGVERTAGTALGYVLQGHTLLTLHAAALLLPGGGAVLATGPTGAGKSTLAAIALQEGWPVLADDLCVIDTRVEPRITGVPRAPAVPADVAPVLVDAVTDEPDLRGRRCLPASFLTRGWHPLVALLRIEHGNTPHSTLSPRSARTLVDDVLFGQMSAVSPAHFRAALLQCTVLAGLPGFTLAHGTDATIRVASGVDRLRELERSVPATRS